MLRSNFLKMGALATGSLLFGAWGCSNPETDLFYVLARPNDLSSIFDYKTILDIGQAYIHLCPQECTKSRLISQLSLNANGRKISSNSGGEEAGNMINQKIKHDFSNGNIVILKGWILASTEAKQCALFYLIEKNN